jgi:hypothetical protein
MGGGVPNAIQIRRQPIGEPLRFLLTADQAAEHRDHLQDLADAALVEDDDVHAAANELGAQVRLQVREREDEIRLELLDLVELRVDECGHFRLEPRLGRPDSVAGNADNAIALAEEVERFSRLFG